MGKGLNELEFDEFEKLLDEIPDATSPTPNSEECGELVASSKNFKVENNGDLDNGKLCVNEMKKSQVERAHREEITSGDNQSLTSAFAGLSFNNGIRNQKATHTISDFSNGHHPNGFLNKMAPHVTSRAVSIPSFRSSGSFVQTKGPSHQESSDLLSAGGVEDFQFISNVHMSGLQFPSHEAKRYIMDSQSPVPSLSQPNMPWRHIEEGKLEGINHYTYMQQLKHHQLEGQVPIQTNSNVASRQLHQNCWQPCNNRSMSHHFELSGHDPPRNKPMISRTINQSNQNWFPEKILTRSHGLNSLRTVKHGSFNGTTDFNNRRVSSNGHCHKDLFNCNSNSEFVLDCKKSRELFVDTADLSDGNWRPLLQKYNSVEEIYGKIYFLAKDQYGCRFLQSRFTEGNREDIDKIFSEIILHIVELMTDPFGNYLVQKLLEVCNDDQQMQIVRTITAKPGDLLRISCDMHGTRSVQKVIETLKSQEKFSIIVSSLKPGIVALIKNMNGNHVAQKCLQYIMPEYRGFLFEAATANCVELATDRYGCCVLQKCLGQPDCEQMHHLICEITSNALVLSQDPFGNYVVQFVFEIDLPWATVNIIDQLEGNYGDLSMQKYSSNVVEKCLKYAGEERRCRIIRVLIKNPHLDQIMQDPYGNYVFQAALKYSKGTLQAALVEAIRPLVPVLRTSPYGKKVLSSISVKI